MFCAAPGFPADVSTESPAALSAVPGDGRASIAWRLSADEPMWGFNVYRFPADCAAIPERANLLPLQAGVQGRFDDVSLENGSAYCYRVAGIDREGREHWLAGAVFVRAARLPGDVDGVVGDDGVLRVDGLDLVRVLASFGKAPGEKGFDPAADLNGDGVVDGFDLEITARGLGTRCNATAR
jgi:hypothetical protein